MKFFYGLKSLITKLTRYKFLGLLIPVSIMTILSINRQLIYKEYPIIGVLVFYLAIPIYICVLGFLYESKDDDNSKNKIVEFKSDNETYIDNQYQESVYDHFEMYEEIVTNQHQGIRHEKRVYFRDRRKPNGIYYKDD